MVSKLNIIRQLLLVHSIDEIKQMMPNAKNRDFKDAMRYLYTKRWYKNKMNIADNGSTIFKLTLYKHEARFDYIEGLKINTRLNDHKKPIISIDYSATSRVNFNKLSKIKHKNKVYYIDENNFKRIGQFLILNDIESSTVFKMSDGKYYMYSNAYIRELDEKPSNIKLYYDTIGFNIDTNEPICMHS